MSRYKGRLFRALFAVGLAAATMAVGTTPASAHDTGSAAQGPATMRSTVILQKSSGQCTVAANYMDHTLMQIQTHSLADGDGINAFQDCAKWNARPAGQIRLAGRWYTNTAGPCSPQTPVQGINNDGFYATNWEPASILRFQFVLGWQGLWPWCHNAFRNWVTQDSWNNIWTWRGQPGGWIGGVNPNAVSHVYYSPGY